MTHAIALVRALFMDADKTNTTTTLSKITSVMNG